MRTGVPLLLTCVVAALGGCARSAPATRSAPPLSGSESTLPETPARPRDEQWGRVRIAELALELELPEVNAWQAGAGSTWFPLVHEPSESQLELRLQRADRRVRPEECEARLRLERPDLPARSDETTVDQRRIAAPNDFVTDLTVSVESAVTDTAVVGHVLGFGAAIGRCLAFHFVTRARGASADAEVARRLGLITERVLPTLRVLGVEDRVEPAPER